MPGYSIAVPDSNPVTERVGVAVNYMLSLFANSGKGGKGGAAAKIGSRLVSEMLNDLKDTDMPPEIMAFYLRQLGNLILWTADGRQNPELPWPQDFQV